MADSEPSRSARFTHDLKSLTYGHFGTPTYDSDGRKWSFLRQTHCDGSYVTQQGRADATSKRLFSIESVRKPEESSTIDTGLTEHANHSIAELSTTSLLRRYPQVVTSLHELRAYSAETDTAVLDPHVDVTRFERKQIAVGRARILDDEDARLLEGFVPIAVHTSTNDSTKLVFCCLVREVTSISNLAAESVECTIPTISEKEVVEWSSSSGPVLQISSSYGTPEQKSTLLAVRYLSGTTIFDPFLHRTPHPLTSSSLDPNPIITIPCNSTGNAPQADVALCPGQVDKIAIIDVEGNWSVWKLTGKRAVSVKNSHQIRLKISGSIYTRLQSLTEGKARNYPDGWHKICWLSTGKGAPDRILVSNRHNALLYDLKGSLKGPIDVRVAAKEARGHILDIMSSSISPSDCFVLTTSHLLWLSTFDKDRNTSGHSKSLTLIACWNHFQNYHDVNARMHLLEHGEAMYIILSSQSSSIILVYQAVHSHSQPPSNYSISDPVHLISPFPAIGKLMWPAIEAIHLIGVEGKVNPTDFCLFKMYACESNGTVIEATYKLQDQVLTKLDKSSQDFVAVPSRITNTYSSVRLLDEDDVSLVPDDELDFLANIHGIDAQESGTNDQFSIRENTGKRVNSCDLGITYKGIISRGILSLPEADVDLEDYLQQIEDELSTKTLQFLLSDSSLERPYVAEVEDDSNNLDNWLNRVAETNTDGSGQEGHVQWEVSRTDSRSLLEVYHETVNQWMATLPPTISDRIRIAMERMSRQVALETTLSSIAIRPKVISTPQTTQHEPSLPTHSDPDSSMNMSEDVETLLLPSSQISGSTYTRLDSGAGTALLATFTRFTQPVPLEPISKKINDILAHLPTDIDSDPLTYSYTDVEAAIATGDRERETEQLDARARKRADRLVKLRERQFEKQQQIKKVAFADIVGIPTIASSSQLPVRGIQSSQFAPPTSSQTGQDAMPGFAMSQPERGTFGTRDSKKKSGKGTGKRVRQKGF